MHVHNYEKIWLVLAIVLIAGLITTITYGATAMGVDMVSDDEEPIDSNALGDDPRFDDPRVEQVGENEYEAYVIARQFVFQPDPIEVPAGSTVTFYLTSADVIHGFEVAGTNANVMVVPGEISKITVEIDEPGEYGIVCNEFCGPAGHHEMEGKLIVVPEDEFELEGDSNE
ncbi:MAG: cytochrome c oxidase subunit II [Halobacteriota archaeon]